jgi:hypothetical protein
MAPQLIYGTDEHGEFNQAWRYDLATGEKTPLIQGRLGRDVRHLLAFRPLSRRRHQRRRLDRRSPSSTPDRWQGRSSLTGVPAGDLGQVRFNRDETRSPSPSRPTPRPSDVFTADLATGVATRLTTPQSRDRRADCSWRPTVVRYKSFDGLDDPRHPLSPHGASARKSRPGVIVLRAWRPGGQSRKRLFGDDPAPRQSRLRRAARQQSRLVGLRQDLLPHGRQAARRGRSRRRRPCGAKYLRIARLGAWTTRSPSWAAPTAATWSPQPSPSVPEAFNAGIEHLRRHQLGAHADLDPAMVGRFSEALYDEMGDPGDRRRTPPPHLAAVPRRQHHEAPARHPGRQRSARAAGRERRTGRRREAPTTCPSNTSSSPTKATASCARKTASRRPGGLPALPGSIPERRHAA